MSKDADLCRESLQSDVPLSSNPISKLAQLTAEILQQVLHAANPRSSVSTSYITGILLSFSSIFTMAR
jgi:hypothetical protein